MSSVFAGFHCPSHLFWGSSAPALPAAAGIPASKLLVGASCIRARRSSCITDPSIVFYSIYMYICLPLIIRSRRQNGDSRSAQFLRSSYSGLQHSIMYHSTRHWAQAATLLLQRNDRVGPACISASHAGAPPLPHPGGHLADTTDVC